MQEKDRFRLTTTGLGVAAVVHAAWVWGVVPALRFVAVAVAVAFVAEIFVIRPGLLTHHTGPKAMGVPFVALAGWVGVIYVAYSLVGFVVTGPLRPVAAGVLATATNLLTDPHGVAQGFWTYHESRVSSPRYGDVPWWNYLGWFVLTTGITAVAAP
ncbi:carotenoid biosynthesis protein [Halogeometricum limi]|uniref:Putative membrane protein n=1 Tax=Halogeometricum limi TaxID=555875 RepID=A0A1I6GJD2_9EURY|nr:carotenoid biosynthesis protein [Halogeometricum limi]SFR42177.1 putative membrane protein [Halogeometricum limi]